jgi:hypothetical protein
MGQIVRAQRMLMLEAEASMFSTYEGFIPIVRTFYTTERKKVGRLVGAVSTKIVKIAGCIC